MTAAVLPINCNNPTSNEQAFLRLVEREIELEAELRTIKRDKLALKASLWLRLGMRGLSDRQMADELRRLGYGITRSGK